MPQERVGEYVLKREIAEGGFGTVHEATSGDGKVAIKILHPHLVSDPAAVARFRHEAASAKKLNHPGIVQVIEFHESDGVLGIVMEYIDGVPLDQYIAGSRALSLTDAVELIARVGEALSAAHDAGIIHRDVKPGNIVVTIDGSPHLTDFGLAKLRIHDEQAPKTKAGHILGTPAYMSPEHCAGHEITAACDLYSLGVVFYEILAGRRPFEADTPQGMLQKHIHSSPPRIRLFNPTIPKKLESLVLKCLNKKPHRRPASASAFVEALRQLEIPEQPMLPESAVTQTVAMVPQRRRKLQIALIVAATVLVLATVIATVTRFNYPPTSAVAPAEENRYVSVPIDGRTERAVFHNLTSDKLSAMVSLENGQMVVIPLEGIQFSEEKDP